MASNSQLDPSVMRIAYVAVFTGLLATIDSTVVTVSLNTISHDFHATVASAQWVITGYLLALALALPLSGWLVERFGSRRIFLFSIAAFALASLACAAAPTLGVLIGFRIIQGLIGGLLIPLGQVVVTQVTPDKQLGRVMSLVGVPASLGPVIGPVLGGLITDLTSWRWIFVINLPLAAIGYLLAARRLPRDQDHTPSRLDVIGLLLLAPGLAVSVFAFTEYPRTASDQRWELIAAGIAGIALLAAFAVRGIHRPSGDTLLDLRLLGRRQFGSAVVVAFVSRAVGDGALLLVTLYLQQQRGATPLGAGLLLIPQGLGALVGLRIAGRLTDRAGARACVLAGTALMLAATLRLVLIPTIGDVLLIVLLVARGLGTSLTGLPPVASAYQGLPQGRTPQAATTLNIAQRLGSPIGTAVLTVTLGTLTTTTTAGTAGTAYQLTFGVAALGVLVLAATAALLRPHGATNNRQSGAKQP